MPKYQMLCLLFVTLLFTAFGGTTIVAAELATNCSGCQLFEESCTLNCWALEDQDQAMTCLLACAEVAADCSCDEPVTLSSENLIKMGVVEGAFPHKASSCNSTTPCPPEYASCGSWSSYSDCGNTYCGTFKFCGDPPGCEEPSLCFGPAERQRQERFRVCFNSSQQACTEYRQISYPVSCGC